MHDLSSSETDSRDKEICSPDRDLPKKTGKAFENRKKKWSVFVRTDYCQTKIHGRVTLHVRMIRTIMSPLRKPDNMRFERLILLTAIFISLATSVPVLGAEPVKLAGNPLDGIYIGTHIEALSEGELFKFLAEQWDIDDVFQQKMLSGELHTDDKIRFRIDNLQGGYQARLKLSGEPGPPAVVQWGVNEAMQKALEQKFKPVEGGIFTLNFMPHSYWLRFQVLNESNREQRLVLELDRYLFSFAHLFVLTDQETTVQRGDFIRPLHERELWYKNIAFTLPARPGINSYYLRLDSWFADIIPLRLWSGEAFTAHVAFDSAVLGTIAGVFIFIFIYNLFIYFSVRDPSYIYLSLMTLCGLATHLASTGFGFQFIWPQTPYLSFQLLYFFLPLTHALFLLFCRSFIEIPNLTPRYDRVLIGLSALFFISALTVFIPALSRPIFLASLAMEHLYYLAVLFPAILSMKQRNRAGLFLLIGVSLHLLASLEWFLSNLNIIPYELTNYLHIKGVSFLVIMTLGLADKINALKKSLLDLNVNLENKVAVRTHELSTKTEELTRVNLKLTELDGIKTRFFTNVSHELRTPLTLILAPLQSFLKGDYGRVSKANLFILESMKRNGDRLLKLINDLLDFSRIEADGMVVERRQTDIGKLIAACVSSVETGAASQGIALSFTDEAGGLMLPVDTDLIEKMLYNLIGNAIKFNKPGGSIQIRLSRSAGECRIEITDTGIGIPQDKLETIFDRFGQADTSTTRKYEGSGIGLALVKEIVQLHDGRISVDSRLDQGTQFMVILPVYPTAPAGKAVETLVDQSGEIEPLHHAAEPSSVPTELNQTRADKSAAILIVEDNPDMSAYLEGLLGQTYHTAKAFNGLEALERIDGAEFDLVLADLMMPEMDGYELLEKLRARDEHQYLPIIFLTARTDTPGKIEGFDKGVNDYMTKPFDPEELLARIRSHLKFKALKKELFLKLKKESTRKSITDTTRVKVESVKQFIADNFQDDISRDELATAVDMSPDHLGRSFKEITGLKISDYLNCVRADEAKKRLEKTDDKIIDIAFAVGFGSLRTFNKAFQEIIGKTPSACRRNHPSKE